MKRYLLYLCLLASSLSVKATKPLHPELEPLRPFLNTTWRGEFAESTPQKPVIDRSRWERALNGQAIRILHSINHGEYGGESLVFWDKAKSSLAFYYFTTAGFYTHGTMKYEAQSGEFIAVEKVENNAEGVTEVKSVSRILPDGRLQTNSQYLKKGQWVPGHAAIYHRSDEEVKFK